MTPNPTESSNRPTALITGGSAGLGRSLVEALDAAGWNVITDGRDAGRLADAVTGLDRTRGIAGDISESSHRAELVEAVPAQGLDLLVLNASTLGPLPLRPLTEYADLGSDLEAVVRTNATAHLSLAIALAEILGRRGGIVLGISSDAAVQHYPGWGLYAASKAALDHLLLTLAAETGLRTYAVDPGDMNTAMHRDAEPGEDLSGLPRPEEVVPHLLGLIQARPASGRFGAAELTAIEPTTHPSINPTTNLAGV